MIIDDAKLERIQNGLDRLRARMEPANGMQIEYGKTMKLGPNETALYNETLDDVIAFFDQFKAEMKAKASV